MPLPTLSVPEYEIKLPSRRKKIRIRPFLAKEQKVLLMAIESGDEDEMYKAMTKILKNCVLDKTLDIESLATFDLEYLMVQLRIRSVDEVSTLRLLPPERKKELDKEDKEPTQNDFVDIEINLSDIKITLPKDHNIIHLRDETTLEMKYPNLGMLNKFKTRSNKPEVDQLFTIISYLIDTIYKGDESYPFKDATKKEQEDFIEQLTSGELEKISNFFETIPTLQHKVKYVYNGEDKNLTLEGIQDFFAYVSPTPT